MGTRSITVVKDRNGNKIIEMYQQYDGYLEGVGAELLAFIASGGVVNGLGLTETRCRFNGMECLAAQLVKEFKHGAGGTYLHAPTPDFQDKKKYYEKYSAEYYYEIILVDSELELRAWDTYTGEEVTDDLVLPE